MITDVDKDVVRKSWKLVIPIADTAADLFYRRLFELQPAYRGLFPDDLAAQKRKLIRMLAFVVKSLDWADSQWKDDVAPDQDLMLVILALGRRHRDLYKIPDESYPVVGEALIWTLGHGLGEAFTAETQGAWRQVYRLLSATMQMACIAIEDGVRAHTRESAVELGQSALQAQLVAAGIDNESLGFGESS